MSPPIVFRDLDHFVQYLFLLEKYEKGGFKPSDNMKTFICDGKIMIKEVPNGK